MAESKQLAATIEKTAGESGSKLPLIKRINDAILTITINCKKSSPEERINAIEFLSIGCKNPDIANTLSDAIRRFSSHFSKQEKIRIAQILSETKGMPPLTISKIRSSLEAAIQKEDSTEVSDALARAFAKIGH